MTALDDRPPTRATAPVDRWEWRVFEADELTHLYQVAELANQRLVLLRPWCLRGVRFALLHDWPGLGPRVLAPARERTCPACATHVSARIPHPRTGTPAVGEFVGDLAEVVTRDERPTRRPRR